MACWPVRGSTAAPAFVDWTGKASPRSWFSRGSPTTALGSVVGYAMIEPNAAADGTTIRQIQWLPGYCRRPIKSEYSRHDLLGHAPRGRGSPCSWLHAALLGREQGAGSPRPAPSMRLERRALPECPAPRSPARKTDSAKGPFCPGLGSDGLVLRGFPLPEQPDRHSLAAGRSPRRLTMAGVLCWLLITEE